MPANTVRGFWLCGFIAAFGVHIQAAAAQLPRIAVVSNTTPTCSASIIPTEIRNGAVTRLAAAGIEVWNIYNARLNADMDCVIVSSGTRSGTMVVNECLTFSELVSTPLNENRMALASTWRKCESYTCNRTKCAAADRKTAQLIDYFSAYLRERDTQSSISLDKSQPEVLPHPGKRIAPASSTRGPANVDSRSTILASTTGYTVIYGIYVLNCLCILLYWQLRKRTLYE